MKHHSCSNTYLLGFAACIATIAGAFVIATLNWQVHHHFAMPFYDDLFDRLRLYQAATTNVQTLLDYLISPHNEHRILTTRLVAMFDERVLWGREYAQVVATNLLQLASAFVAFKAIAPSHSDSPWPPALAILAAAVLALLFVNPNFLYTLVVPFQLQHAIMGVICLVAAWLVSRASDRSSPDSRDGPKLVLGLLVLAVVGTFTLGNAPVILIAATAVAITLRWSLTLTLAIAALAAAHVVAVLLSTQFVSSPMHDLFAIVKFTVIYLGAPLLRLNTWPASYTTWSTSVELATIVGTIIVLIAVVFAPARLLKPGLGGRTAVFGLMILVIVIITGLAAASSRAQFGVLEAANKKYASFAALGFVGALAIACGVARDLAKSALAAQTAILVGLLAFVLPATVLGYGRETRIWQRMIERNWEAASAVFVRVDKRDLLHELYGQDSGLRQYVEFIELRGRSIFSHFSFRWGDDVKVALMGRTHGPCRAAVHSLDPIPEIDLGPIFQAPGTSASMSGWTWMEEDRSPPAAVIAVDGNNRIVGLAFPTRVSDSAEQWLGQKFDQSVGWHGFSRRLDGSPLSFIALSRSETSYCQLGQVGTVTPRS